MIQATLDWNFSAITSRRRAKFLIEGVLNPFSLHIGECQPHEDYGYLICDVHKGRIIIHDALNSFKITGHPGNCKTCGKKSSGHMEGHNRCWTDKFYLILEDDVHEMTEDKVRRLGDAGYSVQFLEERDVG